MSDQKGPLAGVRVIDLTRIVAGPYCTMVMGDMGAEVIKIESPKKGDFSRYWGPPFAGGESAYFFSLNKNKKSITLNLKTEKGREILRELVKKGDVLLENFRVDTMDRMGIGYEDLRKINPMLIYVQITGYGSTGPLRNKAGYDVIVSGEAGLMSITGEEDGGPVKVGVAITDVLTGLYGFGAIASALYARDRIGRGQKIELSLFETQVATLINIASSYLIAGELPKRWGTAHATIVPYQAFRAKDDYVLIGVGSDDLWVKFCKVMDMPELAEDPRFRTNTDRVANRKECIRIVSEQVAKKEVAYWVEKCEEAGIPCGPINTLDKVFAHPQTKARKMVEEIDHPTAGRIKLVGIPVKLSETPGAVRLPPPLLGQHTEEVLKELCGYNDEEIASLRREGII